MVESLVKQGVIIICLCPLIVGLLFMLANIFHIIMYKEKGNVIFARREFYLYPLFLMPIFIMILIISFQTGIIKEIKLKLLNSFIDIPIIIGAGLIGVGWYYFELLSGGILQKIPQVSLFYKSKLLKNKIDSLETMQYYNFYVLVLLSVIIGFLEEFMWRGFLITVFRQYISLSVFLSILLSSFLFGINHLFFGFQAIILKTLMGSILGLMYVLTSNLLIPFISHVGFNIWLSWRFKNIA